jgi:hypothetical protein
VRNILALGEAQCIRSKNSSAPTVRNKIQMSLIKNTLSRTLGACYYIFNSYIGLHPMLLYAAPLALLIFYF